MSNPWVSPFIHPPKCLEFSGPVVPTVLWVVAPSADVVVVAPIVVVAITIVRLRPARPLRL